MAAHKTVLVHFKTEVRLSFKNDGTSLVERQSRMAALVQILQEQGFTFETNERGILAFSENVAPQDIKKLLNDKGFRDQEFQIRLEYFRNWGMM